MISWALSSAAVGAVTSRAQSQREKSKYRSDSEVLRAPPHRINLKPALVNLDLTQLPVPGLCVGTAGLRAPCSNSIGRRRRCIGKTQRGICQRGLLASPAAAANEALPGADLQAPVFVFPSEKRGALGMLLKQFRFAAALVSFSLGGKDTGLQNSQTLPAPLEKQIRRRLEGLRKMVQPPQNLQNEGKEHPAIQTGPFVHRVSL